jgi:hypothetical protein
MLRKQSIITISCMILNSAPHFPKEFSEIVKEFKLGLWSTDLNLAIMT